MNNNKVPTSERHRCGAREPALQFDSPPLKYSTSFYPAEARRTAPKFIPPQQARTRARLEGHRMQRCIAATTTTTHLVDGPVADLTPALGAGERIVRPARDLADKISSAAAPGRDERVASAVFLAHASCCKRLC